MKSSNENRLILDDFATIKVNSVRLQREKTLSLKFFICNPTLCSYAVATNRTRKKVTTAAGKRPKSDPNRRSDVAKKNRMTRRLFSGSTQIRAKNAAEEAQKV